MYFETVVHEIKQVANATEAAELIKSGSIASYVALQWDSEHGTFLAVSDAHIDDSAFAETAMIQKRGDEYFQIESITAAWCSLKGLIECFKDTEKEPAINKKVILNIGKADPDAKAFFTCGCCGEWFESSVEKQLKFDQDSGYGICKSCERFY
jgi:hypothetical protein